MQSQGSMATTQVCINATTDQIIESTSQSHSDNIQLQSPLHNSMQSQSQLHSDNISQPHSSPIGHYARQLTSDEIEKLKRQDSRLVSEFKKNKLEKESRKHWDQFYARNETRFFKDRHWTKEEFKELCPDLDWQVSDKDQL